jgi:hypothetical protein
VLVLALSSERTTRHRGDPVVSHDTTFDAPPVPGAVTGISSRLEDARAKAQRQARWQRRALILAFVFMTLPAIDLFAPTDISDWITVPMGWAGILFLVAPLWLGSAEAQGQVERLESLERLHATLSSQKGSDYFDRLVTINVDNLAEYYALVKVHTQQSFQLSSVVATIGFALIVAGLTAQFLGFGSDNASYATTAAGTMVEVIAGLFFYLYNKTVRQLKEYHDGLLDVQNILLSFKLIDGTKDESARANMTLKMIEFLAARRRAVPAARRSAGSTADRPA